ncbi:hypothetical protein [Agromyces subbeticus]|uniref:hypothetical protein n=1 Tax=Agromyces subbeticus TaxID=293890 RepID=UPI0003B76D8E|nr:hypothetical protein [Agromyces subbeticus]
MYAYALTDLTGRRRNEGRTDSKAGFEYNRRHAIIAGIAVACSLPVSAFVFLIVGPVAFVVVPLLSIVAGFLGFEARSRKGLKQRMYRSALDKRNAGLNRIYLCWRPISANTAPGRIVVSSRPTRTPAKTDLFDGSPISARGPVISRGREIAADPLTTILGGE